MSRCSLFDWFTIIQISVKHCFIDYYENSGEGAAHYAKILSERGTHNGGQSYNYGTCYLPHDADNETFAGDSPRKVLQELGIRRINVGKRVKEKGHAIEAARRILPTCYFDEANTAEGRGRISGYRKEWDAKRGVWKDRPVHDKNSHGTDAFMEFATNYKGPMKKSKINYGNRNQYAWPNPHKLFKVQRSHGC